MSESYPPFLRWAFHFFRPHQSSDEPTNGWIGPFTRYWLVLPLGMILCLLVAMTVLQLDSDTQPRVHQAHLVDLNDNGRLDVFLVYLNENQRILLNEGAGRFTFDRQLYIINSALAVGDITGDGQPDLIRSQVGDSNELVYGPMPPGFTAAPRADVAVVNLLFATWRVSGAAGVDGMAVFCCKGSSTSVRYLNNPQPLLGGAAWVRDLALADLNGNGRLDAFLVKGWGSRQSHPNEVWFNDGHGNFHDSGQRLGSSRSLAVVLGDLTGNGSPDAVVGNNGAAEIWLNDGQGNFSDSGQRLGRGPTYTIFLADLSGNGHLDLFLAGNRSGRVWLNDGAGQFSGGQTIRYGRYRAVALGDVTGDGVMDIFAAALNDYRVWRGVGDGRFRGSLFGQSQLR